MNTVGDVLEFLETLAPRYMKMDWDHVGLLCGRSGREVRRILVALDPFQDVCQEAADWGAELLVTHHPLIFQPPQSITDDTSVGRCILFLAARDMAAINAHTNLDCAPGGVNDCLAGALGLEETGGAESLRHRRARGGPGACSVPDGGSRFPWRPSWSR